MRSRLGRRTAWLAHAAAHDGHGQTGCHVVQPGSRRSSQRSDCQRDRRIRRPNGPYHRPHDHSVPDAQPVEGCGNVEPRAQCDKTRFSEEWRRTLENTWNLYIWQDAATELLFAPAPETNAAPSDNLPDETTTSFNSAPGTISSAAESDADSDPTLRNAPSAAGKLAIRGVRTRMGVEFSCRKVILTSGTFLGGVMHCGASHAEGGRAGTPLRTALRRVSGPSVSRPDA